MRFHRSARRNLAALFAASGLFGVLFGVPAPAAHAQFVNFFTDQHVDVDIAYENDQLTLALHDDDTDQEFDPADSVFVVSEAARTTQPADPAFSFIGAGTGGDVWILPQSQIAGLPLLGISAEEVDPALFNPDGITLSLLSVSGPGQFSLWRTVGGAPVVGMATSDGVTSADFVTSIAGANHVDYNVGFTAEGLYGVTLRASGTLNNGQTIQSEPTTYYFQVGNASAAVPEPGTLALFALAGLPLAGLVVRRHRRA